MPNTIKTSQMAAAVTLNPADYLMIVQDGVNKKSDLTNILKNLNSVDTIRLNPIQNSIDIRISSKNDANMVFVQGASDRIGFGTNSPQSKVHVVGNVQVGSNSTDGILVQSSETISYSAADQTNAAVKPISPLRTISTLDCNTGVSGLFSLSNGFNGEVKTIAQNTLDAGKTSTITLTGLGFNTITLNAVGKSTMLQFSSAISKWIIVGGNSAVYSTI